MDESMVDIVLILLAALVAVAVIPEFDIELPVSQEIDQDGTVLRPLQISIKNTGQLYQLDGSNQEQPLYYEQFYEMLTTTEPTRVVEVHADQGAPAIYLLEINRVIQKAGRNSVFLVKGGGGGI